MKLKFSILVLICTLVSIESLVAQSAFARKIVDTLSSAAFWGRGYTNNGLAQSAKFIEDNFISFGLKPIEGHSYQQYFDIASNTFPGKMELKVNGKKLVPGRDFIINPKSRGLKGRFVLSKSKEKGIYYSNADDILVQSSSRLIWTPSQTKDDVTHFIIKDSIDADKMRIKVHVDQRFVPKFRASNVCAIVKGTAVPDSFLVLTAHYDHLGGMGDKVYFPGANDNASGVALLLEMAKYYAQHPPKYSVVFIAFAAEEIGLEGSKYFVAHSSISLDKIKFLLNLDLMGNGEEGITVVNATKLPQQFQKLKEWNANAKMFKAINERDNAANSDHYPFTQEGVPAFFIYTLGGDQAYHDIFDVSTTLPLNYFPALESMIKQFFNSF